VALLDGRDEHVEIFQTGDIAADARCVASDLLNRRIELRLAPAGHDNRRAFECQTLCVARPMPEVPPVMRAILPSCLVA
jgi:hypothetical protein